MYEIIYRTDCVGVELTIHAFGFSKHAMNILYMVHTVVDEYGYHDYNLINIKKLKFSLKNFIKCLTKDYKEDIIYL